MQDGTLRLVLCTVIFAWYGPEVRNEGTKTMNIAATAWPAYLLRLNCGLAGETEIHCNHCEKLCW